MKLTSLTGILLRDFTDEPELLKSVSSDRNETLLGCLTKVFVTSTGENKVGTACPMYAISTITFSLKFVRKVDDIDEIMKIPVSKDSGIQYEKKSFMIRYSSNSVRNEP